MRMSSSPQLERWPALPLESWRDTYATLHMWTQVVGKIRMACTPWTNHSWHVTLYVTARGLTTSPIPLGTRTFQIDFDFIAHRLIVLTDDGRTGYVALEPQSVATFYKRLTEEMEKLELRVRISCRPCEIEEAIRFDEDEVHCAYDAEYVNRFWRILVQSERVFKTFRARFAGKCSPVHYFWGGADLALTRFSGRPAPPHPGGIPNLADWVTREAYSDEVSSCGFWAGGGHIPYAAYYSYAYPEPAGFQQAVVRPSAAFYSGDVGEFILPYDAVRHSKLPDQTLLEFLQTRYDAAANLAQWDRKALERAYDRRNIASAP
jgi:hypothetical protein